jgi:hypothetical protein
MANQNAPSGAFVVTNLNGTPWNGRPREYVVDAGDANPLFLGDLVVPTNVSGATFVADSTGKMLPVITLAGATDTPIGVVIGFKANPNNLNIVYKPASTLMTALVCDDPNVLLEIQTNGTATNTWAYKLANIVYAAGSTYFGTSGSQLDSTTVGSTGTVLEILDISQRVDNSLGQYCKLICKFKLHALK